MMVRIFTMMKLINNDCLIEMAKMDDESIDAVVCDLPYFQVVKDDFDNQWKNETEYLDWVGRIIAEYNRLLKPNGNLFLFTSRQYNRHICMMLDEFFKERRIIIWCRNNP